MYTPFKPPSDIEYEYTPEYSDVIKVKYHVINPGEPAEKFYPGCDPEIEIFAIEINEKPVSECLYTHLLETRCFEEEIIDLIKIGGL